MELQTQQMVMNNVMFLGTLKWWNTTVSNTNGTITSTVQVNTNGFSIVLYTGNATNSASSRTWIKFSSRICTLLKDVLIQVIGNIIMLGIHLLVKCIFRFTN